ESGGTVLQETRHWEPASKRTITMRVKETADDYRLFPEPDLAPYDLSDEFIQSVRDRLPELPDAKKQRFMARHGLPFADAVNLAGDVELAAFFDEALSSCKPYPGLQTEPECACADHVRSVHPEPSSSPIHQPEETQLAETQSVALAKPIANLLLNDVAAYLNANNLTLAQSRLTPANLAQLAQLVADDTISSKQAKEVFSQTAQTGEAPTAIVEQRGMQQLSDTGEIEAIVAAIIAQNPEKVAEYQAGKTGLIGFFVGQAMKATNGQGNPKLINETIAKRLQEPQGGIG
ncbi:MAG: hypothetical protein LBU48_01100, partial [Coriobacteriales bacterium]|nr:hypothetical protein [Coriobacteriales bacterium]